MQETFTKLTELIKTSKNIIFITHQNMDLDGFGSILALSEIATSMKIENYILVSKTQKNENIVKSMKQLESLDIKYIYKDKIKEVINEDTLVVIVDVHKPSIIEMPEILEMTNNIVVIDHHMKCKQYIQNTVLNYINSNLSSTIEFTCFYLKYLNKTVNPIIATLMLAGMEIDTNSFNLKTTDQTFEAASLLMKMGADNVLKIELLKEDKDEYLERQSYLKNTYIHNNKIAICPLDNKVVNNKYLASIAEDLLQFDGIEASFCIGYLAKDQVGISARSLGVYDVEDIMKSLGGGGHISEAATQIKNINIESAINILMNEIEKR